MIYKTVPPFLCPYPLIEWNSPISKASWINKYVLSSPRHWSRLYLCLGVSTPLSRNYTNKRILEEFCVKVWKVIVKNSLKRTVPASLKQEVKA